jgi:hypothetical protein
MASKVTDTTNGVTGRQPNQTFHLQIAPDGHVLAAAGFGTRSGKGDTGSGVPGIDQVTPLLPDAPVDIGTEWAKSFDQVNPFDRHRCVGRGRHLPLGRAVAQLPHCPLSGVSLSRAWERQFWGSNMWRS